MIPLQFYKLVAVNKHDCARVCKWCIHTLLSIKLSITYRMQPMYETVEQWEALKLYPHHYLSTWYTSVELFITNSQKRRLEKIVLKLADHTHLSAVATEMHILAALTPVRSKSPCYQSVGLNSRAARTIRILFLWNAQLPTCSHNIASLFTPEYWN